MADQENNNKEESENLDPILDEDAFSLDLDDFDLGDDDLEESPGLEPPTLDDVDGFDDTDDESIGDLVLSSTDNDDEEFLDIDLDSDLNLLGEEDPVLHDDELHADFNETEDTIEFEESEKEEDDLELEFDDDIIDLDGEIEAILNGEDGILTNKKKSGNLNESDFSVDEEEEGPIALSMEELENITGGLLAEEDSGAETEAEPAESEMHDLDSEDVLLPEESEISSELEPYSEEDLNLELNLDDTEVDTQLTFNENGYPELDLDDDEPEEKEFKPLRDAEEEELFGSAKEDENLTLSDDELGNILGSSTESLEESLGNEEDFFETEELPELESTETKETSTEEDDDGPITLSLEELDNIDAADEPELNILDEEVEDETITLSPDELGSIIASEETTEAPEAEEDEESNFDIFGDDSFQNEEEASSGLEGEYEESHVDSEDDEGPLALSMDELESIAEEAEESSEDELVDSLDRAPLPYEEEKSKSDLLEEDLEDESIALSMEELENITGSEEEDAQEATEPAIETVSGDKIDDLIGEELPGDNLDDIGDLPMEDMDEHKIHDFDFDTDEESELEHSIEDFSLSDTPDLVEHEDLVEFGESNLVPEHREPTLLQDDSAGVELDLDEYAPEGKLSPLEELRASQAPEESEKSLSTAAAEAIEDTRTELSSTDRKKVLSYLDNLLGNLPDEVIKEFSKSQYFELYKKMMKELEL
ncbi:hypothetical protein EHQ58_05735 [Leptospira ognonensis]|uniref:Uncharacterized protein n=1 Tax=Leptospira ognonensis TaxID=2484945 RepID=A0A4R9K6S9_9LEPT|nr:hypothetical protein [Leptospira ognonensis]TGL61276.1 hypothetical protein EHQ58_05735 [Leptospira ognonensis]